VLGISSFEYRTVILWVLSVSYYKECVSLGRKVIESCTRRGQKIAIGEIDQQGVLITFCRLCKALFRKDRLTVTIARVGKLGIATLSTLFKSLQRE
jgi:hypothetical protein